MQMLLSSALGTLRVDLLCDKEHHLGWVVIHTYDLNGIDVDYPKFKASLVTIASSRPRRTSQ